MRCYAASPFEIELPFDRSRRKQVPLFNFQPLTCQFGVFQNQQHKIFEVLMHDVFPCSPHVHVYDMYGIR